MNQVRRRFPNFVDVREEQPWQDFQTVEELFAIDWVELWKNQPRFIQFSKSDSYLMAEVYNENGKYTHWAIGYLKDAASVNLPVWVNQTK